MSGNVDEPRLVFLHGVRKKSRPLGDAWYFTLEESFGQLSDAPELKRGDAHTLQYKVEAYEDAVIAPIPASKAESKAARERYKRRQKMLRQRLRPLRDRREGVEPGDLYWRARKALVFASRRLPFFKPAEEFRRHKDLREAVVAQLLPNLPSEPYVLVAHSLGSMVAVELLRYLPVPSPLTMLVTIGSPLSNRGLYKNGIRSLSPFPYAKVGSWVNLRGRWDPVTGGKGLDRRVADVVDIPIDSGAGFGDAILMRKAHRRKRYLKHQATSTAIALGLAWVDEERAHRDRDR